MRFNVLPSAVLKDFFRNCDATKKMTIDALHAASIVLALNSNAHAKQLLVAEGDLLKAHARVVEGLITVRAQHARFFFLAGWINSRLIPGHTNPQMRQ